MSLRGELPKGYYIQWRITFNLWAHCEKINPIYTKGVTIAEAIHNELYAAKLVTFGKSSKGRLEGANAIKKNPELPDTNGEDHLMDAICYGLMSRPYAPTKIKPMIRDGYRREESPSAWSN